MSDQLFYLIIFCLCGILIAAVSNILLLQFSSSLGIRNKNDVVIRWSNQSKPSLGGVSFYAVFIFTFLIFQGIFKDINLFSIPKFSGVFIAGTIAFIMGLADDAYNTKPLLKLSAQIFCGIILVHYDSMIKITDNYLINSTLTVFWVVLLMNSLNMLDNMDGITGTVVLFIIATSLIINWIINGVSIDIWSILNISLIGGLIGFLYFNINPSKLFMGDAGSQFFGFYVAFVTIENIWMVGVDQSLGTEIGFLLILITFTAPFSDTLTVVINRLKKGQSPMIGGKDHTTHHLVYAGLNDRQVWYVFVAISFIFSTLSILSIYFVLKKSFYLLFTSIILGAIVFILLYRNTLKHPQNK